MAQEMSESRKKFVDMMLDIQRQDELAQAKEKVNQRVEELNKELSDIFDRAYSTAIKTKDSEYQEKANNTELTAAELQAIQDERKDFEADPSKYGVIREKCAIVDEADRKRVLQIVNLLKDTKQLEKDEEKDFLSMIEGFGDRQLANMTEAQREEIGKK